MTAMTAAAESPASHKALNGVARGRGGLDKFSFFAAFLIGSAGIVLLKARFNLWQGYVVLWSVGWMFVYLLLVTAIPRYRLRPDQAGDNLYYLGFLYTLVSLSVALYFFTDPQAALEQIISNFGIALSSTILGVALRVFLHQMRDDPVDTEREARQTLADAASRLRSELDVSVREMNGFVRQMRQSVDEALHGVTVAVGKRLEDAGSKVADAAEAAGDEIRGALSNYADHSKALNSALGRHVQATEKLSARIEAIEVPVDLLDRRITPALEKIVTLVDAKLDEIRTHAAGGQEGVMRAQMAMLTELREKVTGQLAAFEAQLAELRKESLSALQESRTAWDEEVQRAQTASQEVTQQLTSMVQTLARELGSSSSQSPR
jgi:hypothetical protein